MGTVDYERKIRRWYLYKSQNWLFTRKNVMSVRCTLFTLQRLHKTDFYLFVCVFFFSLIVYRLFASAFIFSIYLLCVCSIALLSFGFHYSRNGWILRSYSFVCMLKMKMMRSFHFILLFIFCLPLLSSFFFSFVRSAIVFFALRFFFSYLLNCSS